tara:strand:+ start:577 stop:1011 length:435 start_codon:yes stop_codon:yes gene_type:complete
MRKFYFLFLILTACGSEKYFGKKIDNSEIHTYESVMNEAFTNGSIYTKISGEILETCQKKGCWMSMATNTDTLLVRFRNYDFFVPTNGAEGKTAIVEGNLFVDTISVGLLRHYAEDAGKSKQEIEKITEPKLGLSFTADGVIIQ